MERNDEYGNLGFEMNRERVLFGLLAVCALVLSGCRTKPEKVVEKPPYDQPLGPGQHALRKITDPLEMPDYTMACLDLEGLRKAIERSANYLQKPSSRQFFPSNGITHEHALESLWAFAELLDTGLKGRQLNDAIREKFDVYMSVGCDMEGTVLFTGYYTPIFAGSISRRDNFQYPLYKKPDDLVKGINGEILGRRGIDGSLRPYPSRAVIEGAGMLRGKELMWLGDPFETYIAHVQGSAKVRLEDGTLVTVGYAANNGHEYRSIQKEMVRDGKIAKDKMSLAAMIDYFKRYKDEVSRYVNRNPRFVFFKEEGGAPRGSLNEPVTTMRTIATDKSIFPRGCLTFLSTRLPQTSGGGVANRAYRGFALDQDTGGAIRAPGRCDVYMGEGELAGELAGQTYQEGRLYYLFLKSGGTRGLY